MATPSYSTYSFYTPVAPKPKPAPKPAYAAPPKVTVPYLSGGAGVYVDPQGFPTNGPAGTPAPPTTPGINPLPTPQAAPKPIDYSSDAWLQDFLGQYNAESGSDQAGTLDKQKQLLLGFGSKELARKLLGENDPFVNSISDDPSNSFSVLANLRRRYDQTVANTNQLLNKQNLWFSGYRGKQLGEMATANLQDINEQTGMAQGKFTELGDALLARQSQRTKDKRTAEFEAWQRAVDEAEKSGSAPPGSETPTGTGFPTQPTGSTPIPSASTPASTPSYGAPDPWMVAAGLAPPESEEERRRRLGGSGGLNFKAM